MRRTVPTKLNQEQFVVMKQDKELFATSIEDLTRDEQERLKASRNDSRIGTGDLSSSEIACLVPLIVTELKNLLLALAIS